jgi:predicted lysophospholipase L1 biosynthesis ABC-type transport system permease subunit
MKEIQEYEKDLASIRNIMERSAKFISLSGLSGVLAGIYALVGAFAAYLILQYPSSPLSYRRDSATDPDTLWKLLLIAAVVLVASIATGLYLSNKMGKCQ